MSIILCAILLAITFPTELNPHTVHIFTCVFYLHTCQYLFILSGMCINSHSDPVCMARDEGAKEGKEASTGRRFNTQVPP